MSSFSEEEDIAVRYESIPGRGNGLVSKRNILKGELLFKEKPFVWARDANLDDCGAKACSCAECGLFYTKSDGSPVKCDCGVSYCGDKCMEEAATAHHSVLCGHIDQVEETFTAHMSCALKICSKILIDATANMDMVDILSLTKEMLDASMGRVLGQFNRPRFTRCIHAFRGGKDMPEALFNSMFLSGYFEGYLLESFNAIQLILAAAGYGHAADHFFTTTFYDEVMGMLLTNCQSVLVEQSDGRGQRKVTGSALYALYSKANHACEGDWENRPFVNRHGRGVVGVNAYANKDIAVETEIMNCYFKEGSGRGLAKSERRKQLQQYRFVCECTMCTEEESSDDSSDY